MTPEQRAMFRGHQKRLAYRQDSASGMKLVYQCKTLGITEVQSFPKRRQLPGSPRRCWYIDGSEVVYRSLEELAPVLQRMGKTGISENGRCPENAAARSNFPNT